MAKMVVRQALGRSGVIGDLYDIRTDSFCNKSMFKSSPPIAAIITKMTPWTKVQEVDKNFLSEKLLRFWVEKDLQLSILSGLCSLENFGPYLSEETSKNTTTAHRIMQGLCFQIATRTEKLIYDAMFEPEFNKTNLKLGSQATHALTEITYGVNTLIILEYDTDSSNVAGIMDTMRSMLNIIKQALLGNSGINSEIVAPMNEIFKITIFSDILPSKKIIPTSFQQAKDFMCSISSLLDPNTGSRGVPLSYEMMPLPMVKKYLNPKSNGSQLVMTIAVDIMTNLISSFEKLEEIQNSVLEVHGIICSNSFCVSNADIDCISTIRRNSESHCTAFQYQLANLLVKVRSGKAKANAINAFRKEFENEKYSPRNIKQLILNLSEVLDKITLVNDLKTKGVQYCGKDMPLAGQIPSDDVNPSKEIYVLNYLSKAKKRNFNRWEEQKNAFMELVNSPSKNCMFSDNDFNKTCDGSDKITISTYSDGKVISLDYVADNSGSASMCFAKSLHIKESTITPKKRAYLVAPCPCSHTSHSQKVIPEKKTWYCSTCSDNLIYGFDESYYCSCGTASCWSYEFKCNNKNHGLSYIPLPINKNKSDPWFRQILSELQPFKEVNILLLGETGVGKSTWINSFVNYLTYSTMEEAEVQGPRYLIGTSFVMTNDKYQEIEIIMGQAENENNTKGKSTTQMPKSYVFYAGDLLVRLIDTPGIGDTRGIAQDKENLQNILSHLAHHVEINCICILLKSNSARMTVTFQFCIKELLTHLHKDACKNIAFVFTNARETFYKPGDTFATLKNLLKENPEIKIELGRDTIYCMDNESMRFLAAANQGIAFNTEDKSNYSSSWKKSVAENERLVQHILALQPHSTRKTISLNEARRMILGLTEPLAQISTNIQNNIFLAENRMTEVQQMAANSQMLKGKLNIPLIDIEPKAIPYPRTVCTNKRCVDAIDVHGTTKINYRTWCHEHCYLKNVHVQKHPIPELQNCDAIQDNGVCKVCGCTWEYHMHITYEYVQVTKHTIDKNVEKRLKAESSSIKQVEIFIAVVKGRIKDLKKEQAIINKVASKCGKFLKQNAITPYNDSVDEYLQQSIRVQKDLVHVGASGETLKGLENMLANYREEVRILESAMSDSTGTKINPEDIPKLIAELYQLPINGQTLKEFAEVAQNAKRNMLAYQEKVYEPPNVNKSNFLMKVWTASKKVISLLHN